MNQNTLRSTLLLAMAASAAPALAETPPGETAPHTPMAVFHDGVWVRAPGTCGTPQTPPPADPFRSEDDGPVYASGAIQTVFLDFGGGTYNFGTQSTNASMNRVHPVGWGFTTPSSVTIPAFTGTGFDVPTVVNCVKDHFQKYNIDVATTKPAAAPYIKAVIGGNDGSEIGFPSSQGQLFGIAANDTFCSLYPNGIAFVFEQTHKSFSATYRNGELCNTIVHEVGHVLGLEHEIAPNDNMSYVYIMDSVTGTACHSAAGSLTTACKSYLKMDSHCGTEATQQNNCSCPNTNQLTNSGTRMESLVGLRPTETNPPSLTVTGPDDDELDALPPAFNVVATATDDTAMDDVVVLIDGAEVGRSSTPSGTTYTIAVTGVSEANHVLKVQAYDTSGNVKEVSKNITVKLSATGDDCIDGTGCHGGICAQTGSGQHFCTEQCSTSNDDCPSGYQCKDVGGSEVCTPKSGTHVGGNSNDDGDDDTGCCSTSRERPMGAAGLLALGVGLVVGRRRRRRAA